MATSDNAVDAVENRRSMIRSPAVSRHDLVLAVIPSVFVMAILVGHLLSLSVQTSIWVASLLGALVVIDALFVNPPSGRDR